MARWLAVLLLAVGCSSTTSNTPGQPASAKTVRVAFFAPVQNGFIQATLAGAKQAAADNGSQVTVFAANGSLTTQQSQIQDATTSGNYDAFVIFPLAPAIAPAVVQAIKAGIKVATVEAAITADPLRPGALPGQVISTAEPLSDRADGLAQMTVEACGTRDPCNVGFLYGIAQNPSDSAIFGAMKAELGKHPNIHIVATGEGKFAVQPAQAAAADMFQAHPDINVLASNSDDMARGARLAAQSAGLSKVDFIGVGASVTGCQMVKAGQLFGTTTSVPRTAGHQGALAVIKAVREGSSGLPQIWIPLAQMHLSVAITKGNAESCPAQWGL